MQDIGVVCGEMEPPTLDQARAAQAELLRSPFLKLAGVGITRRDGVIGLKVNVGRDEDRWRVPREVDGVPIHEVEFIGENKTRD